jgi:quinol monooxygenase YgiN
MGTSTEQAMHIKQSIFAISAALVMGQPAVAAGQETAAPYIRLAELQIDPAGIEQFNAAVTEGVEAAVRLEPGVLALYAVAEKDHPDRIHVFEMYVDARAYETHLQTPHFKKFRDATARLVKSRTLLDAIPVVLGAKSSATAATK